MSYNVTCGSCDESAHPADLFVGFCTWCTDPCCDRCGEVEGDIDGNTYTCGSCLKAERCAVCEVALEPVEHDSDEPPVCDACTFKAGDPGSAPAVA